MHGLTNVKKEKRICTTNPQHKEDLQTKIHETCASHTHLLRQDTTIQEIFNGLLTIMCVFSNCNSKFNAIVQRQA